ncbi:MAG: UDP-N-acetylmuramoyl-tripeptide--D-alanyl-D-alanine ligase [Candidatus Eremiobacteraeota bacterium]|nr:UDP-N-acetylmuramoyl-tripeptide--D-alanyl-D-alanine ligase [Candidatus Eremiobacteraeota bacterium]
MTIGFEEFLKAARGRMLGAPPRPRSVFSPSTDSRTLRPGEVFVCLLGPKFDGHDHIDAALAAQCSALVVSDLAKVPAHCPIPVIAVSDTKAAYLAGAAAARRRSDARVIAVTGSNGKTTTKSMIAMLLGTRQKLAVAHRNENNELGVAKMCYALGDARVAVLEFGSRKPGDIAQLVQMALPDVAVLTNVGEAHLEFFADSEHLAREKFSVFASGARPVLSAGDTWTRMLAAQAGVDERALWARMTGDAPCAGPTLYCAACKPDGVMLSFAERTAAAGWRLPGVHHLRDAILAAGAALVCGESLEDVAGRFGDLRLPEGRFEIRAVASGATIVYDAYNASPTSLRHALEAFAKIPGARHIAVLGSMAELGPQACSLHERSGAAAAACGVDALYCGGEHAGALARGARSAGLPADRVFVYDRNDEVAAQLRDGLRPGDAVLLKGSRAEKMEQILEELAPAETTA